LKQQAAVAVAFRWSWRRRGEGSGIKSFFVCTDALVWEINEGMRRLVLALRWKK